MICLPLKTQATFAKAVLTFYIMMKTRENSMNLMHIVLTVIMRLDFCLVPRFGSSHL